MTISVSNPGFRLIGIAGMEPGPHRTGDMDVDIDLVSAGLDGLDQGIAVFDRDLRLRLFNSRFVEILDLPSDLARLGMRFEDLVRFGAGRGECGPGSVEEVVRDRMALIRDAHPLGLERLVGGKSIEVRSRPLAGGSILTTYTDITRWRRMERELRRAHDDLELRIFERTHHLEQEITERRYTEDALRASEDKYRATINSTSEGYWAIDPLTGLTIEVNGALCQMLGYGRGEILGRSPLDFAERTTQRMLGDSWREVPTTDQWRYEIVLKAKDRRSVYALVNATSIKGADGKPARIFAFLTDISERRLQEERLARSEADAQTARAEAELANRAKSDFLSSMSHELRTPLNAILGFGQLLQFNPRESLSPAQNDYVDQILKAGNHLLDLINEVLDLAKIEAGKVALSIEEMDPRPVVEECLGIASLLADRRGIRIEEASDNGDYPLIRADQTRFKQVLLNLLSNAVKYNRDGGRVTVGREIQPSGLLRIHVVDTGIGIPAGKRDEIFQAFSRLGAEATSIEGTGIGLTLTQELIGLMGGSIDYRSKLGEGSDFWIDIPLANGSAVQPAGPLPEPPEEGSAYSVLYLEDNPANLRLMAEILGRVPNLTMRSAHTAELGFELARQHRPDIILVDMELPGLDSVAMLEQLRTSEVTRDIPAIAVGTNIPPRERQRGIAAGFHGYLSEPFHVDEVLGAIETALAGRPQSSQPTILPS